MEGNKETYINPVQTVNFSQSVPETSASVLQAASAVDPPLQTKALRGFSVYDYGVGFRV